MIYIVNNISIILLFSGIIFLSIYLTKATSNNYQTTNEILLQQQNRYNKPINNDTIYDIKPSKVYKKMFLNPSIGFGYNEFDEKDVTDKIYVKTVK
jgi:hypothetical protein